MLNVKNNADTCTSTTIDGVSSIKCTYTTEINDKPK